jgi:hypothetical protein
MLTKKQIIKGAVVFLTAYMIMIVPQTRIGNFYGDFFRNMANRFLGQVGDAGIVIVKPQENERFDTMLFISKKSLWQGTSYKGDKYNISSRTLGFLPSVLMLALIIATPVKWKRKITALIISFAAMTVFVLVKLYVIILYKYQLSAWIGIFLYTGESRKRLILLNDYFAEPLTPAYTLGIFLWIAFCFRKKDWENVISTFQPAAVTDKNRKQQKQK